MTGAGSLPFCSAFSHFAFQLCLPFLLILAPHLDGCDDKGSFLNGQAQEFGRFPAKLLQAEMGKVGLRVTVQYQFFASATRSSSVLKPLTWKTSVT